jgi:hypothetical protein
MPAEPRPGTGDEVPVRRTEPARARDRGGIETGVAPEAAPPPPAGPRSASAKARPASRPAAKVVAPPIPRRPAKEKGENGEDRPAVVILPSPPPQSPGPGAVRISGRGTPRRTTQSRRVGSG